MTSQKWINRSRGNRVPFKRQTGNGARTMGIFLRHYNNKKTHVFCCYFYFQSSIRAKNRSAGRSIFIFHASRKNFPLSTTLRTPCNIRNTWSTQKESVLGKIACIQMEKGFSKYRKKKEEQDTNEVFPRIHLTWRVSGFFEE